MHCVTCMTIEQNNTPVIALEYDQFSNEVVRNCAYGAWLKFVSTYDLFKFFTALLVKFSLQQYYYLSQEWGSSTSAITTDSNAAKR